MDISSVAMQMSVTLGALSLGTKASLPWTDEMRIPCEPLVTHTILRSSVRATGYPNFTDFTQK